jgi:hypothetical protein
MAFIARSASSQPSAIIFNGACLLATGSTSRTSPVGPANGAVGVSRQLEPPRFPNQVRGADIAYAAVGSAHMYLTCAIAWYSRYIVGWRLAADMGAAGAELRREIADCVEQRNGVRPHQSLGNGRPSEWCHSGLMAA